MGSLLGACRDLVHTVALALGAVGFLFAMALLPYYVLLALPDGVGAALCGEAFFCWPTLLVGGVVTVGAGVAILGWLSSHGYLRVPEVW